MSSTQISARPLTWWPVTLLDRYKFDGWTVRWVRVTVTGSMSKWLNTQWKPVTSNISQGIPIPGILEPVFSIFIADSQGDRVRFALAANLLMTLRMRRKRCHLEGLTGSRSEPKATLTSSTRSSARPSTYVRAEPSTSAAWGMKWEQSCGEGFGSTGRWKSGHPLVDPSPDVTAFKNWLVILVKGQWTPVPASYIGTAGYIYSKNSITPEIIKYRALTGIFLPNYYQKLLTSNS